MFIVSGLCYSKSENSIHRAQCVSYLDLTGSDQVVDVVKSFLHSFPDSHQAVVPQDENLQQKNWVLKNKDLIFLYLYGIKFYFGVF